MKPAKGVLEVLPAGPVPPDPGEFVGTEALSEILQQLRNRADIVLVDTPPVLRVSDALTLSSRLNGSASSYADEGRSQAHARRTRPPTRERAGPRGWASS